MGEIKFRAWHKEEKRFVEFEFISNGWCLEEDDLDFTKLEAWQQYTGLKDKNGKEIYFGDIVQAEAKGNGENDPQYNLIRGEGKQQLFCECDPYYLRTRFTQKQDGLFEFSPNELKEIEVIGNVFESPELLTK